MRKVVNLNKGWKFFKGEVSLETAINEAKESVTLPHTWNAMDGQDGGNELFG